MFKNIPKTREISKEDVSTKIPKNNETEGEDSSSNHQSLEDIKSKYQRRARTVRLDFEMYLVGGDQHGSIKNS